MNTYLPKCIPAAAATWSLLVLLAASPALAQSAAPATPEEDDAYVRGDLPRNAYCPSGKVPLADPVPPRDP